MPFLSFALCYRQGKTVLLWQTMPLTEPVWEHLATCIFRLPLENEKHGIKQTNPRIAKGVFTMRSFEKAILFVVYMLLIL